MNYSDSFRQGTPSRHYSQRVNDNYEIVPPHHYSAAYDNHNWTSRPGPSSAAPDGEESRPGRIDGEEETVIEHAGPSVHRASAPRARVNREPEIIRLVQGVNMPGPRDRRARVDDEPEPSFNDPDSSSRPHRPERGYGFEIEAEPSANDREQGRRGYEADDNIEIHRRAAARGDGTCDSHISVLHFDV